MLDEVATRRLAAIVSVDVAGYTALTEADEPAAVQIVSALKARIEQAAEQQGGRVFNTAGDGFMLEFPTVSGALAAAEAIRSLADPPVRIGAHLGEMSVTASGDLLGHGVNVAARLQALAHPGEILISGDMRRALRGPLLEGLKPRGQVRLDGMNETAEVFVLGTGPRVAAVPRRRRTSRVLIAAGLVGLAILLGAAGWIVFSVTAPKPMRIAVLPITAPAGDTAAASFASGLTDGIAGALAERNTTPVSRDAAQSGDHGGARLLVGGEVERIGGRLRVRMHVDDTMTRTQAWVLTLERPTAEADALQNQASIRMADVLHRMAITFADAGKLSPDILNTFLTEADLFRFGSVGAPQLIPLMRRVVQAAPNSSRVHSDLGYALAFSNVGDSDTIAQQHKEAEQQARLALELDPRNSEGYRVLAMLARQDRKVRLDLLQHGLKVEPQNGNLLADMSDLLAQVGRNQEAVPLRRLALALDPLSPSKTAGLIFTLAAVGATPEAEALARRGMQIWPDRPSVRQSALTTAMIYSVPDQATATLDAYQAQEPRLPPATEKVWRNFIEARRNGHYPSSVLAALRHAVEANQQVEPSAAVMALALAGDPDDAFALIDYVYAHGGTIYTADVMDRTAASLQADPRFFALMRRLGILRFWRETGVYADFCGQAGVVIDCKAEAAKP